MRTSWKTILETSASEHTTYPFSIFYPTHPGVAGVFGFSLILFFFYISIFSYPEFLDPFKIQSGLKDMASLLHGNGLKGFAVRLVHTTPPFRGSGYQKHCTCSSGLMSLMLTTIDD
jgi:hypothetical protein